MSDAHVHRELEIARVALMDIADLPDEKANHRTAIVNSALTRMHKLTATPQHNKQAGLRGADPTEFLIGSQSGGCPYVRTGFPKSGFFERMANLIKQVRRI